VPDPRITVRLPPALDAWLTAVADVRQTNRADVVREAISWVAARESARVARTRHYRVIGLLAAQEAWNPVEDYLRASDELARDEYDVGRLSGALRATLRSPDL
jgi:Arc/MetJ-type ribon-helix-helix transcriptional regulator